MSPLDRPQDAARSAPRAGAALIARLARWLGALVLLAGLLPTVAQAAVQVTGLQLVSSVRFDRTRVDYTYRITVANDGPALSAVQASVVSNAPATQVVDGSVALGNLAANATLTSTDTFTLRQDRTVAFNPAALVWTVVGVPVAVPTLELALSDTLVAPDGTVSITPKVRDGAGAVIDNATLQFSVAAAPLGTVTGNAPVVSGLTVRFPKLLKRLIAANPTLDPAGEFADTDPTDPNYGRETGGQYRLTVRVPALGLSKTADVTVLPSGTAAITAKGSQYAGQLGNALALALQASQGGDAALMAQARSALQAIDANRDFTHTVLSTNVALAPPDGRALTPALLSARGFTAGVQDAAYAAALADLTAKLRQARSQLEAVNTGALTQAAVDALQTAAAAYKQSLQTLKTLQSSALGTVQQQAALNALLATELPRLLDAIKRKTGELLGVATTAALDEAPRLAFGPPEAPSAFGVDERPAWLSDAAAAGPRAMYAATQPVQYYGFFSTMFGILTDLSGTARGNIIELSLTLANSLLNIQVANVINQGSAGGLALDYCLASSSFAYVCPNYIPTRIGGSGFGRDAAAIRVAVVGCVDSNLLRNVMTLRQPSNLAAGIRLINKVVSITNSLRQQGGVAAVVVPDYIAEDDFGMASDMLYFAGGWPRVNQGRLPCVGVVIVMNTATGTLSAVNLNMLGTCG